MNKIILGLLLGTILGVFDGLTAWFTPAVRSQIVGIVIGSTIKGLIAGVLIGVFARKVHSLALGIVFGLAVGLALAFIIARLQHGDHSRSCCREACRIDRRLRHAEIRQDRKRTHSMTELLLRLGRDGGVASLLPPKSPQSRAARSTVPDSAKSFRGGDASWDWWGTYQASCSRPRYRQ